MSLIWVFSLHTGRLRNLEVTNHTQHFENGSCEIQLTCSVENPNDNASFRWQVAGNTILEEANLTISWEPKDSSEETYTCIAKNPVSNLSFSFSVQSLCKGNSLSQASLKALSSCRVWCDHMTDMIPQTAAQQEAAKYAGRRETLNVYPPEVSPSSLTHRHPRPHTPPQPSCNTLRAQEQSP